MFKFLHSLFDYLYRSKCYICKKSGDSILCGDCFNEIELNPPVSLKILCGAEVFSASVYSDNLKAVIRGLKYHRKKDFAYYLAKILYNYLNNLQITSKNSIIVPTPLYPKRKKERGYNHVELIADELGSLTGWKVNANILRRIKNTKPHYKLTKYEREQNVKDAFEIDLKYYNGENIIVVDDICTSGATLQEIIKTFQKNAINKITALVCANP